MKKRFLSILLAMVMAFSILPTASLAAGSVEEALGEIDIYNGGQELSYLMINGRVRTLIYTYYNYVNAKGEIKEIPAYCVNPNTTGVPQTVDVGESIEYLAEEKTSDPKVLGIVANGYPTRSLEELGLENKYQGYYATKMALWCYLLSNWDINNLKVNSALSGVELQRAQKMLAAAKDIYARGTAWNEVLSPEVTCTPDRDTAYEVTIDGKQYKQQVFTFWSKTWVCDYAVEVSFTDPGSVPRGTRIVDMNNRDITTITTEGTGDGYAGKFKVLYPLESVEGETGSVQLSFRTDVYKYAVFYAICQEKDEYGELQNYVVDTDPTTEMDLSTFSNYADQPVEEYDTGLRIIKYETGTEIPISGARFEVVGPDGDSVGTFVTNGDGRIEIPLSKSGNYTVIEREAPQHYMISEEPAQNVTVVYDEVAEVTFFNDPYGTLRIEKKSNTGMNLPGAVITVEHIESGQTFTATTSSAGVAIFDAIPLGAYRIQEKTAPVGWQLDDTVYTATVVAGETTTIPIINEELPGLRIIKYDRKNMVAMPNVTFAVYRDGEFLGNFKTDQFGEILIADAEPGTYRAFEVDTGDEGHILDTTPQEVELHAGDGIKELMFFNDMKPGLKLIKVDSDDPSKVIPNAVFEIKSVEGTYGPQEFRTDQSGEIDLSMLPAGSYVVTEKSCDGYIIDEAQRIIELKPNEDAQFVFTNHVKPSLQLIKLSSDGSRLAGVTFRIARIEDGSHYLDRTTNSNGEILISDLEPGVYSVRELSSVQDHIPDDTEHHVELFPGQTSTITLTNDKRPNLYIHKTDADTGEPIEHTVYLVKGADGHSIAEVETDENGVAVVENLLPGVVEIIEKSVPEPYLLAEESQMVTLLPNRDRDVYFQNYKRPTIEIIKENSITHDRIENVPFQVWYASNNTATGEYNDLGVFYTDEEGRIVLSDPDLSLRDGWFRVKELEPAPGFALADPDTQEAFIAAGEGHTFRFLNRPLSAISVWKYDSETGAAIEGAVFQVRYLSGNTSGTGGTVIGTYRTSVNGSFTVTGCKAGTYIIEELSSDGSHVIDTPPQTVYLSGKDQEVVQVYFNNSPKGSLLIKKVSSADNSPISDVQFFVTESDGTVVGDSNGYFVTDSAGTILIEGIDPGTTLVVKETRAKDGFILDDTPQTAQIQAGQTVTLEFRNQPTGQLIIHKLSGNDKKTPLEGVQFKITYSDGSFVDADSGQLSSNGLYWTNSEGQIILSGLTGTVVVTEVESIPGYTIDPNTQSQTVVINPNDTQELYFYNNPIGGIEIIKVNASKTSERIPDTTFEIRRMDDALVDTITTDRNGRAYLSLEDGSYYALEVEANPDFVLDDTPHYFEVKNGEVTTLRIKNEANSGILIHKVDTSGEGIYPMRSLHLLGSSRTLEDLVHRLEHVQDFRTSTGADLGSCKMITTSGRGERRTIRLYKSALPLLQTLHPAALAHYLDITRNHRFSGSAEHIERNHRVAETVAMCLVADVETRPFLLPVLQRRAIQQVVLDGASFYTAKSVKRLDHAEMNKTIFTRLTGALFSPGYCYAVYNTRNAVMKWSGMGEFKTARHLEELSRMNAGPARADHALLLGENMDLALQTLLESDKSGRIELRFDRIYPHVHFIPMTEQGIRLLRLLTLPDWKERVLSVVFPEQMRTVGPGVMEYDAQNGNTLILSHLDGDIARLVRVRQALEHSKVPYEIMCFPWQCPFLHGYIGPRAQLREISMTDLEAALGIGPQADEI